MLLLLLYRGFDILLQLDDKGDVSARDNGSGLGRLSLLGSDLGRASSRVIGLCLSPNNYSACLYTVPSTVELSPLAIRCLHPNNQESKVRKHLPENQENRTTPIPGARKVGAQGEDELGG
ncbi:hypothetical protein GQ457_05G021840 [Hibiscus cannabinus]